MTDDSQPNMRKFLSKLGDSLLRDATTVTGSDIDHNCDGIDLGDCEETCTDEVGVWLLIDPDTEVRPYCLPCIGSNDYGNVYAASHMVTYMDGEMEITSLIYMKLELVGVIDSGEEYVKWRLGLFLTNMGEPASDPEVRLETNIFNSDVTGITGPPYCPDEAPDSTPAVNEFLNIVRDEASPLALSTNEWSMSDDVRLEPTCDAAASSSAIAPSTATPSDVGESSAAPSSPSSSIGQFSSSELPQSSSGVGSASSSSSSLGVGVASCDDEACDQYPTVTVTVDAVLEDPPGCVGGQTLDFTVVLTQDAGKACRWTYSAPGEPSVSLECFAEDEGSDTDIGFWVLEVTDAGGNRLTARRLVEDGSFGDYVNPPGVGGGITASDCNWTVNTIEVGA